MITFQHTETKTCELSKEDAADITIKFLTRHFQLPSYEHTYYDPKSDLYIYKSLCGAGCHSWWEYTIVALTPLQRKAMDFVHMFRVDYKLYAYESLPASEAKKAYE